MPTDKQIETAQGAYRAHVAEHGVDGSTEAMRAALEAAECAAWEPIETAPTGPSDAHSEIFFVCGPLKDGGRGDLYIAKARSLDEGPEPLDQNDEIDASSFFNPAPTHWRPLPPAPETAK